MTTRTGISIGGTAALVLALVVLSATAWSSLQEVADRFESADYTEAGVLLETGEAGVRTAEDLLWQSRLTDKPARALEFLEQAQSRSGLPREVRIRIALEIAELETGRGKQEAAIRALNQLLLQENEGLPGTFYLRAGLAYRAIGNLQKAREMLAAIRPGDVAFAQGRGTLGEIGLQQNDPTMALGYFESVPEESGGGVDPILAAGLWSALRRTGEHARADQLVEQLRSRHPGCLALLEISRILRTEQEELAARGVDNSAAVDSVATRNVDRSGRYTLQLGAFSDRGLAMEMQQRFLAQIPDLRIEQLRDRRGQFLYKVRTGSFVNPALANTEAVRLARLLGVEVFVTDLAD